MATAITTELGPLGLENPMGTDGFEFVEYAAPDPSCCATCSPRWASRSSPTIAGRMSPCIARATSTSSSMPSPTVSPSASPRRMALPPAMAFRVKDAYHALNRAIDLGADPVECDVGPMELRLPAIEGIGGSRST